MIGSSTMLAAFSLHVLTSASFQLKQVTDGDTVIGHLNDRYVRIRLECIDAPEQDQDFGLAAKQYLSNLLREGGLTFSQTGEDRYGRKLGFLYSSRQNINQLMVAHGYAWNYDYYCADKFQNQENQARARQRGLWQDQKPIAPWEWRRRH